MIKLTKYHISIYKKAICSVEKHHILIYNLPKKHCTNETYCLMQQNKYRLPVREPLI